MVRETLTREKVLDAALAFVDQHGMAALSMRKLAAELGVEAMSLYNHVRNKGDLLDGLVARMFEAVPVPDPAAPWDVRVRGLAEGLYAQFRRHPAVLRTLVADEANPRSPGALKVIDSMLGALLDAGLDDTEAVRAYRSLTGLTFGAALTEETGLAGAPLDRAEPVDDWFRRMATPSETPHLHRLLPVLTDADCRQDFEAQLNLLVSALGKA
ncbi:TetR/AcrR family transcriptional regulator C-terminal domain-containing protein [Amycolatopsis sp. NPDC004079]|uniref:TetR/AcrR family transcriptional regulator C-terminal domain-containing protein n=1 Tax=Amycolatopsis sp. NPDC004079 TaxID=3154549 RepID=UPI0033A61BA3